MLSRSLPLTLLVGTLIAASASAQTYRDWQHHGSIWLLTTPEGANLPAGSVVRDFPVLLRLNREFFDFSKAAPDGADLRFSSAAGTPLSFQIEQWDPANGQGTVWVRVPEIAGNSRQELQIHWGKPDAAAESNGSTVFSSDNGFVSVLHMDETLKDELGVITPKNQGTTTGPGMIGMARRFTKGKGISGGDHVTGYPHGDNPFTADAWFRSDSADTYILYYGRYATRLNGSTGDGNEVGISIGSPPSLGWASDGPGGARGATIPRMGQWYHVAASYENGISRIFLNGKLDGESKHTAAMSVVKDVCMDIGGMRNGNYRFNGDIDEVRISKVARSDHWMKLAFENQKDNQTLAGPIVQPGDEFTITPAQAIVDEGSAVTFHAKAGGALKLYWLTEAPLETGVAATDRFSFTLKAPRVTANTSTVLRLRAVFASGEKTITIPVTISEHIPEPTVKVTAPPHWNGRDSITVKASVSLREDPPVEGTPPTRITWSVTGGAVLKNVTGDTLTLNRSQFTGKLRITATAGNGGEQAHDTAEIIVTESPTDPWIERTPATDEQPEDNQFYARDDRGEGTVYYNGRLDQPADSVFLKLYADNKLLNTVTQKLSEGGKYSLTTKLKPGLIKYHVEFGTISGDKEVVLRTVRNLICGDAYIIDGQSNAEATGPNNGPALDPETSLSTWIRSFGNQHEGSVRGGWSNAVRTRIWGKPDYGFAQIGTWGMVLARNLVEKHHIPVCIINSAYGGTPIYLHQRNPDNHFDTSGEFYQSPYKIYGGLLTRVTAARLTHGIRGIFWHQGENDQGSGAPTGDYNWKSYQQYFVDMAAAWKEDFPNVRHYYIYQIWPSGCSMGGTPAGDMLLDVQRTLPDLFSNMRIMSTLGIVSKSSGRGLCHFDEAGYAQIAELMQPVVEQDNYGLDRTRILTAPNLRRAYFTSSKQDEVALEFDQPMIWKDACKAWLELDRTAAPITSGKATGNTITVQLSAPVSAKSIGYINGAHWDGMPDKLLYGTNGIAALAFSAVNIETAK
jgi:hypothetical protein